MMDSFEFTKISAAVLSALLLIFLPKTMIEMARTGHSETAESGYTLPAPTEGAGQAADAGAEKAVFDPTAVVALVGAASAENGAGIFKKCIGCHTAEAGAGAKAGPNLWNVVGRNKGAADFKGYSDALKAKSGEVWSFANLAGFLHSPKTYLPGTKMGFSGIPENSDLADLLAYMRTLADNPAPVQ